MTAGVLFANLSDLLPLPRLGFLLYAVLGVVALVALFTLLFLIVCMCERQRLTGVAEPVSEPFPYPPSPYWLATRSAAMSLGLQHAGDLATKKNTSVSKGLESLFISPDRLVIVSIASVSAAGAKLKKTILRSRLATGRILESSDDHCVEDLSGVMASEILLNAGIAELMEFHLQRLRTSGSTALPFDPNAVGAEFGKLNSERAARWVMIGLARWADPDRTSFRMTFRGALATTRRLVRQAGKLKNQSHRSHVIRAGSHRR